MNLEEELNVLESKNTMMNQPIDNNQNINMNNLNTMNNVNNDMTNLNMFNTQPTPTVQMEPQYQQVNQPAMVNPNQAQSQVAEFNFTSLAFDINKQQNDNTSLPRLSSQSGESFRLHILPTPPSRFHIHTHYNSNNMGSSFVCLKDAYGTPYEPCCTTHGYAKPRNVIPVLVYPTVQGNLNSLIPGAAPELRVLIINDKKLDEIKQAAVSVTGKPLEQINLDEVDIIARVDNPQFKSHIFNCTPTTYKDQVAQFIPGLVEKWKQMATPENICRGASTLLTREEYMNNPEYANYDFRKHQNNNNTNATPTSGGAPGSFTFSTPVNAGFGGNPYGMGNGVNQNQPFYNGTQSQTGFNQNPWGNM